MTKKERYAYILDYFRKNMPVATTELQFSSAFQLLCATLLSAQCTDKRINQVTPALLSVGKGNGIGRTRRRSRIREECVLSQFKGKTSGGDVADVGV